MPARAASKALWTQTIPSEHTAHFSDWVLAATRLRRAEEAAAKANIEQALKQIATLNLPSARTAPLARF